MLPKIVHSDQKGFINGRYIGENIRLLYDVLLYTETEKITGLLLMVDFGKAFDSVSWSFIQKALEFFNFGPDIRRWIKTFYNNASTCVQINGHYSSSFNIGRAVCQGDPLSPYLYLIGAEILSTMFRENGKIKGIKINQKKWCFYYSLLMTVHFVWMAVKNNLRKVYRHLRNLLFSLD